MKRFILIAVISYCFACNIAAKHIKIINATEYPWYQQAGEVQKPRTVNLAHGINYNFALYSKNLNSTVLDSLYIDYTRAKLIMNSNIRIDSLHHTYIIVITSTYHPSDVQPESTDKFIRQVTPNSFIKSTSGFIVYEYKGKKHKLYIKEITVRINNPRKNHYRPC